MQPPSRRGNGTNAALALLLALAAGCGSSGSKPPMDAAGRSDSSSDRHTDAAHTDAVADVSTAGHCCALQLGDGASSLCGTLNMDAALGPIEACLSQNTHGTYGRWTCGTGAEPPVCGNNGLSCGVGEPCTLVDVGCPGVVQACNFKPYTPPPG